VRVVRLGRGAAAILLSLVTCIVEDDHALEILHDEIVFDCIKGARSWNG
jgi:hypothetical protein